MEDNIDNNTDVQPEPERVEPSDVDIVETLQTVSSAVKPDALSATKSNNWVWRILIFVGLFIVAPIIGCGAFGLGVSAFSGGNTTSGSAVPGPLAASDSVAIVRVEGPIFGGESSPGGFATAGTVGSDTVIRNLQSAEEDPNVQAIVLRVNSPGGAVVPSDEIYNAITQLEKPIVVSMGSVAASGGYYISAPTDYIFATPNSITGSIGVISQFITVEELLNEYGVEVTNITTGEFKDAGAFSETLTEEEIAYWEGLINESYDIFVEIVADGRGYTDEEALELADGRVFTGTQALEVGLIDEIGYLDDAIAYADQLGGIVGEPNTIEYYQEPSFLDILLGYQQIVPQPEISLEGLRALNTPTLEYRYLGPQ